MDILRLVKALFMAKDLPIYMRIPVILTAWGVGLFALAKGIGEVLALFRCSDRKKTTEPRDATNVRGFDD